MTMPSLFSQFVPSISSTSREDLNRSASDGADSIVNKLVNGGDVRPVEAGGATRSLEEYGVAGATVFWVTHLSATRTEGLGSTTGAGAGGETILGEGNCDAYEVATGLLDVFGVASSGAGLERCA